MESIPNHCLQRVEIRSPDRSLQIDRLEHARCEASPLFLVSSSGTGIINCRVNVVTDLQMPAQFAHVAYLDHEIRHDLSLDVRRKSQHPWHDIVRIPGIGVSW